MPLLCMPDKGTLLWNSQLPKFTLPHTTRVLHVYAVSCRALVEQLNHAPSLEEHAWGSGNRVFSGQLLQRESPACSAAHARSCSCI